MSSREDCIIAQRDECDSMSAIFDEDFTLLCSDPVSYSIELSRPECHDYDYDNGNGNPSLPLCPGRRRPNVAHDYSENCPIRLSLVVSYPEMYPLVAPILRLVVPDDDVAERRGRILLHPVQERAVLDSAYDSIAGPGGPCVYGCVIAARDYVRRGGLVQAGLALLSDDCLARVLTYLVATVDDVEDACEAMPIFRGASMTNAVWRPMCRRRWGDKWGFRRRWERTNRDSRIRLDCSTNTNTNTNANDDNRQYWMRAYHAEEADAMRNAISREELGSMTFDIRYWFSSRSFRNQPDNMRDVLPTGLRESVGDVVFEGTGLVSARHRKLGSSKWVGLNCNGDEDDEGITRLVCSLDYTVHRTLNWGWELRSSEFVLRAMDKGDFDDQGNNHRYHDLWGDLIRGIVMQERPHWVQPTRFHDYNFREIPDDEDCKSMLSW
ncbi:hypothetical protein ACHAXA_010132 [Cyclostephanos tholiformis]|uniref:RWD domain-containing protein n=1 Tax=Cyclostephanos tholiformis TaxID=382380 RepID=A0ABD3R7J7_9STRA